jgi:hypothetical protein
MLYQLSYPCDEPTLQLASRTFKRSLRVRLGISNIRFYRGHNQASYLLLPGFFRIKNELKHERNLYAVFTVREPRLYQKDLIVSRH